MKMTETTQEERDLFYWLIDEMTDAYQRDQELMDYVIERRTDLWIDDVSKVYGDIETIWDYFNQENDPKGYRYNQVLKVAIEWAMNTYIDFIYQNDNLPKAPADYLNINTEEELIGWFFSDISLGDIKDAYKQAHPTEVRNQLIQALLD